MHYKQNLSKSAYSEGVGHFECKFYIWTIR